MTTGTTTVLDTLSPVALSDIDDVSAMARYDRKYLVSTAATPTLLSDLAGDFGALDIDGRRTFDYLSVYFDTPDFATFRMHRQGRRRRFKIRTRHYGDPASGMLEVKCKSARGQTVKYRRPHTGASPYELDADGHTFIAATLRHHYGLDLDLSVLTELSWTVETSFQRSTLVDLTADERVTIDTVLSVTDGECSVAFDEGWAIAEAKSPQRRSSSGRALRNVGARERRLSKYCLGIAVLHADLPASPWQRSVRTLTGAGAHQPDHAETRHIAADPAVARQP
ncbi:MAG: VTC domain-containing protein [Nitriliruptoraceae bacterium]